MTEETTKKLYHTISEVARLTGVKAHVLRYWESEFSTLRPRKTRSGSRRYRQQDIDEVLAIRELLYEKGFRIAGARKVRLQAHRRQLAETEAVRSQMAIPLGDLSPEARLETIRQELRDVLGLVRHLKVDPADPAAETDDLQRAKGEA